MREFLLRRLGPGPPHRPRASGPDLRRVAGDARRPGAARPRPGGHEGADHGLPGEARARPALARPVRALRGRAPSRGFRRIHPDLPGRAPRHPRLPARNRRAGDHRARAGGVPRSALRDPVRGAPEHVAGQSEPAGCGAGRRLAAVLGRHPAADGARLPARPLSDRGPGSTRAPQRSPGCTCSTRH